MVGRTKIRSRDQAARRPVLRDIAQAANVSVMTASRAINGGASVAPGTRARVLREAEGLGYRPSFSAQSLRTNKTGLIGVFSPNLMMPLQIEVVLGARDSAAREGYRLLLDVEEIHDKGRKGRSPFASDGDLLIDIPAAEIGENTWYDPSRTVALIANTVMMDSCTTDLDRSAFAAIRHLVSTGHQRISLMAHAKSPALVGYDQAVRELGIASDARLVQIVGNDDGSVIRAIDELLALPEMPDALIVVNVAGTPLALRSLERRGVRIGRDLGFVGTEGRLGGWGDLVTPKISVIRVPGYEIGAAGAQRLIDRLRGEASPPVTLSFPSELVIRDSTRGIIASAR